MNVAKTEGINRSRFFYHRHGWCHRFKQFEELIWTGWHSYRDGLLRLDNEVAYSLYEGKMFTLFDHMAATVTFNESATVRQRQSWETTTDEYRDLHFNALPFFWVPASNLDYQGLWRWIVCFKKVTSPTNKRTLIATVLPRCSKMKLDLALEYNCNSIVLRWSAEYRS